MVKVVKGTLSYAERLHLGEREHENPPVNSMPNICRANSLENAMPPLYQRLQTPGRAGLCGDLDFLCSRTHLSSQDQRAVLFNSSVSCLLSHYKF